MLPNKFPKSISFGGETKISPDLNLLRIRMECSDPSRVIVFQCQSIKCVASASHSTHYPHAFTRSSALVPCRTDSLLHERETDM